MGRYVQVFGHVVGSLGTAQSFRVTVLLGCHFPTVRPRSGRTVAHLHPEGILEYANRGFQLPACPKFLGAAAPRMALVHAVRRIGRGAA